MKLALVTGRLPSSVRLFFPADARRVLGIALHARRISTGGNDSFPLSRIQHQEKKGGADMRNAHKFTARAFYVHTSEGCPLRWAFLFDTPFRAASESLMFLSKV